MNKKERTDLIRLAENGSIDFIKSEIQYMESKNRTEAAEVLIAGLNQRKPETLPRIIEVTKTAGGWIIKNPDKIPFLAMFVIVGSIVIRNFVLGLI